MSYKNEYRIILQGEKARKALKKGADTVADLVKSTMGPGGRNILLEKKSQPPVITNDGVRIAKNIILKDEIEDLGAQALINASVKTNSMVGDGTTATIVIAQAILNRVFKELESDGLLVNSKINLMRYKRNIMKAKDEVLEELAKRAKQIKNKADLEKVAITSLEDEELGKVVAEMAWKIGKDGHISVDEHFGSKVETEIVNGMKKDITYVSEALSTNARKEAVMDSPLILITNNTIETQKELVSIINSLLKQGIRQAVLIANNYDRTSNVVNFCMANNIGNVFTLFAIKAPSLDEDELEDVAIYTGAKYFDKRKGMTINDPKRIEMGKAKRIVIDRDKTFIVQGEGSEIAIKERIEKLKSEMEIEPVENFKNKIKQRIASLSGGVGIIRVATNTNVETVYLKDKVDDAVCACKAAMQEGIVKGGGLALKEIAEKLPENILTEPLKACYEQIQENAGGGLDIEADVIDPSKVIRIALENACSVASVLITANGAVAEKREDIDLESLEKALKLNKK